MSSENLAEGVNNKFNKIHDAVYIVWRWKCGSMDLLHPSISPGKCLEGKDHFLCGFIGFGVVKQNRMKPFLLSPNYNPANYCHTLPKPFFFVGLVKRSDPWVESRTIPLGH